MPYVVWSYAFFLICCRCLLSSILQERLMQAITMVHEANSMSEEMDKVMLSEPEPEPDT